jgi:Ca2+-dependent lipid-binding protein
VNNCLNPVWNQTFDFVVEDGLHDMLIIEVWDHDTFGKVKKKKNVCCIFQVHLHDGIGVIIVIP